MNPGTIYAVIWTDFIPLHLPQPSAEAAVEYAKGMHQRAKDKGIVFGELRAVSLKHGSDKLETLWSQADADAA